MEHLNFNNPALLLEILAVALGLAYVILAALKNRWCWPFGILGSLVSMYIFVTYSFLYAEAILYCYYVLAGIWGWIQWNKPQKEDTATDISQKPLIEHLKLILLGLVLSVLLFLVLYFAFPKSQRPLFDSLTTVFSFIATWITIKKWIENWLYWIVINVASVILYYSRGLEIYALLMLLNAIMAVYGYFKWKKMLENA
jgi:nicotinamide mononucleotide transporter